MLVPHARCHDSSSLQTSTPAIPLLCMHTNTRLLTGNFLSIRSRVDAELPFVPVQRLTVPISHSFIVTLTA
jgi:hypothetical protein